MEEQHTRENNLEPEVYGLFMKKTIRNASTVPEASAGPRSTEYRVYILRGHFDSRTLIRWSLDLSRGDLVVINAKIATQDFYAGENAAVEALPEYAHMITKQVYEEWLAG